MWYSLHGRQEVRYANRKQVVGGTSCLLKLKAPGMVAAARRLPFYLFVTAWCVTFAGEIPGAEQDLHFVLLAQVRVQRVRVARGQRGDLAEARQVGRDRRLLLLPKELYHFAGDGNHQLLVVGRDLLAGNRALFPRLI